MNIADWRLSALPGRHLNGRRKQPILRQKEDRSPNSKESGHGLLDGCTIGLTRRPQLSSRYQCVASFSRWLKPAGF